MNRVACVIGLVFMVTGCTKREPVSPPRSTLVKSTKEAAKAGWLKMFSTKGASLPNVLTGVSFTSPTAALDKLPSTYTDGKSAAIPGVSEVTLKLVRHADTRTLRSVKLQLPKDAKAALSSRWGDPTEGQVDGQRKALFWFDDKAQVQAILEANDAGYQLKYWPYFRLSDALRPGGDPTRTVLADWLGKTQLEAAKAFPRQMKRRARPGFVAWLAPFQYRTRPLSVRFGLDGERINTLSFKVMTTGNPGMYARVAEMIQQGWKVKPTETDSGKVWTNSGKRIQIYQEQPGRMRPRDPIVRVTIQVVQAP